MLNHRGWRSPSRSAGRARARRRATRSTTPTLRARPPPRSLPGADESRQAGERAEEHRPVLVVLGADQRADDRRADRAVLVGQRLDVGGVEAADGRGRPFGRPVGDVLGELVEAERVSGDPVLVDEAVADQHVHHRQHQGDVGARAGAARTSRRPRRWRVRIGSITTTLVPSARASSMVGQRWRLVSLVLVPHRMISLAWRMSSGSMPWLDAVRHRDAGADGRPADRPHEPASRRGG